MKKSIGLVAASILIVSLAGCGTISTPTKPLSQKTNTTTGIQTTTGSNTKIQNNTTSASATPSSPNSNSMPKIPVPESSPSQLAQNSTQKPVLILYAPKSVSDNLFLVSGHVSHIQNLTQRASVYIYDQSGRVLTSSHPDVSSQGIFKTYLPIKASNDGIQRLYIGVSYPGAVSQGLLEYTNLISLRGSFPDFIYQAAQNISKGTTFPLQLPTWVPQSLTPTVTPQSCISIVGAQKSFTYSLQLLLTPKPYEYNAGNIESDGNPSLANIQGVHFSDHQSALKQLTFHLNQVNPTLTNTFQTINLGSSLTGKQYTDKYNTIEWQEGKWTMVVRGPDMKQNVLDAKEIVRNLDEYYLPPTDGVIWLRNISVGNSKTGEVISFTVNYVYGNNLYTVSTNNNVNDNNNANNILKQILHLSSAMNSYSPYPTNQ